MKFDSSAYYRCELWVQNGPLNTLRPITNKISKLCWVAPIPYDSTHQATSLSPLPQRRPKHEDHDSPGDGLGGHLLSGTETQPQLSSWNWVNHGQPTNNPFLQHHHLKRWENIQISSILTSELKPQITISTLKVGRPVRLCHGIAVRGIRLIRSVGRLAWDHQMLQNGQWDGLIQFIQLFLGLTPTTLGMWSCTRLCSNIRNHQGWSVMLWQETEAPPPF